MLTLLQEARHHPHHHLDHLLAMALLGHHLQMSHLFCRRPTTKLRGLLRRALETRTMVLMLG